MVQLLILACLGGDNGDGVGLSGDNWEGEGLGANNRNIVGLGADNGDGEGLGCVGLSGDNWEGEGLGADNEDGEGLGADNGDGEGLGGDNGDDKTTFMIKTLVEQHECRRVCNNKEAKVKWISSKFESIVKSNPSINVKVLADLLLDKFNVHQCFMSDRQKGLIKAMAKHFPTVSKRFCARHIYANFRGSYYGDNFKKLLWSASSSTNIDEFNVALKDIGEIMM
ncbi:hypothetical protein Ddye_023187 [Dipteronia dyeriana]|uniref:MULE transposase domain-containing protein n=1 Tax=Dipteronia dyeriana TaxID=168575 RepID=A0AAD9TSI1_9ROSI|nr:hypothetical protein Ddye_023187 [Dipteronia dyeriana]